MPKGMRFAFLLASSGKTTWVKVDRPGVHGSPPLLPQRCPLDGTTDETRFGEACSWKLISKGVGKKFN